MSQEAKDVLKGVLKGLSWIVIATFFGLLQLAFLWGRPVILKAESLDFTKIILDGVLLFFATTLVVTVALDYYCSSRIRCQKWVEGLIVNLVPLAIVVLAIWLYVTLYGKSWQELESGAVTLGEGGIVTFAMLYAWGIKSLLFFNERITDGQHNIG